MSRSVVFSTLSSSMMEPTSDNSDNSGDPDDRLSTSLDVHGSGYRRRALSLAETQPSVETVIVKAKRAAQSLWMLLHAQNCVLGQKCPHTGCQEAKLLHLHLKTCAAGGSGDAECPMLYHGCDQSRKLLAHYRRCRSLRARQASANGAHVNGKRRDETSASTGHHHCLVCSLVARQARTMLERKVATPATTQYSNKSAVCVKKAAAPRKASYTVSTEAFPDAARRCSLVSMPPPPPKRGEWSAPSNDSLSLLYDTAKQLDGDEARDVAKSFFKRGRNRAVSDAEIFEPKYGQYKTEDPFLEPSSEVTARTRERSASVGHVPAVLNTMPAAAAAGIGSSCDTIQEEDSESQFKSKTALDNTNLPI